MTQAFNVDCMEAMREFPNKYFDLAVVDPPYGGEVPQEHISGLIGGGGEYNGAIVGRFGGRFEKYQLDSAALAPDVHNCRGRFAKYKGNEIRSWDFSPPPEYFRELARVSKNQIIFGGNYFDLPPTRCFLIWRKTNIPLNGFSMSSVEYAWTSFNDNARCFEFSSARAKESGGFHPTEKPIALYAWIYQNYAKAGDKILDTHLGSGSSRIAAYDAGLDFWGYEIDTEYFEKEEKRFADYTAQMNLFID